MKRTFIATASLEGKEGYAVKAGTSPNVVIADANAVCLGIIYNANDTAGETATIALDGEVVKAKAGGNVAIGDFLKADANGALVTAGGTGDDNVIAQALETGTATGGLFDVVVVKFVK